MTETTIFLPCGAGFSEVGLSSGAFSLPGRTVRLRVEMGEVDFLGAIKMSPIWG